jgi:GLPGLI family protein
MKSLFFTIILFLFLNFYSFSQISKGHISYSITVDVFINEVNGCSNCNVTPEVTESMEESLYQGSKMDVYFSKNKTRSELTLGCLGDITTISDAEIDSLVKINSGLIGPNAVKTSISEMSKIIGVDTTSILQLESETKTILNYNCKKAVRIDKKGTRSIFWYTTELIVAKSGHSCLNFDLPGFPLEFELNGEDISYKYTAIAFDNKVKEKLFDLKIPKGYYINSIEDLRK